MLGRFHSGKKFVKLLFVNDNENVCEKCKVGLALIKMKDEMKDEQEFNVVY